ncbi:MAG: hypothetical protein ABL995_07660 [Bryobacteraceae bacterium]
MRALLMLTLLVNLAAASLFAADKYDGPRPPQADQLYLVHADNLVATESVEAKEESGKKDETVYSVSGAASSAKTPIAEPIFLLKSDKLSPDKLELYKMDVKNGRREIAIGKGKRSSRGPRPLRLSVTKLEGGLYRLEASQPLDNGQYSVSPSDSNKVFCFEVY